MLITSEFNSHLITTVRCNRFSIYNPKANSNSSSSLDQSWGIFILADEINRTSPKTQSALLESMEEGNITIDGMTDRYQNHSFVWLHKIQSNMEGTYPLPEAQLDRFLLKLGMGYPTPEEEFEILNRMKKNESSLPFTSYYNNKELLIFTTMRTGNKHGSLSKAIKSITL